MTHTRGKILIVDDQLNWREVFIAILAKDYDIMTADNYSAAEALVGEHSFNVAILDIRLRDENVFDVTGISLAHLIKALRPETRIVIATGYPDSVKTEELRQVVDAFIEKAPEQGQFKISAFKALIRKLSDQALL